MTPETLQALKTVRDYMHEQMYGDEHTDWTYGNEHDRMREAYDLVGHLICSAETEEDDT